MNVYALDLKVTAENSAFDDGNRGLELARILRRLADRLEGRESFGLAEKEKREGTLFDRNGNCVGNWKAATRRIRC